MIIADCISNFTTSYGLPVSLFLAGLVGGFTHCVGMCSPFVFGQVQGEVRLKRLGSALLLPYHFGRMATYVGLAIVLSSVINLAFLFSDMRALITAPLLLLAGLLFLVSAFPVLGQVFPWVVRIQVTKPFAFIAEATKGLMFAEGVSKKFLLGVLLGLYALRVGCVGLNGCGNRAFCISCGNSDGGFCCWNDASAHTCGVKWWCS